MPAEAEALRDELAAMLPRVPLASVLVEVDARTGFTGQLVHAGGKVTRSPELTRNLLYVLIAEATNLALTEMAASAGVSYDALAWTAEWYFRPETLAAANAAIVNYHHRLPFAQIFGTGTLSSADGQRFPVGRQVDHRQAPVALLRPWRGGVHLHRGAGSARHLRHPGDRRDRRGGTARARRDPR